VVVSQTTRPTIAMVTITIIDIPIQLQPVMS